LARSWTHRVHDQVLPKTGWPPEAEAAANFAGNSLLFPCSFSRLFFPYLALRLWGWTESTSLDTIRKWALFPEGWAVRFPSYPRSALKVWRCSRRLNQRGFTPRFYRVADAVRFRSATGPSGEVRQWTAEETTLLARNAEGGSGSSRGRFGGGGGRPQRFVEAALWVASFCEAHWPPVLLGLRFRANFRLEDRFRVPTPQGDKSYRSGEASSTRSSFEE